MQSRRTWLWRTSHWPSYFKHGQKLSIDTNFDKESQAFRVSRPIPVPCAFILHSYRDFHMGKLLNPMSSFPIFQQFLSLFYTNLNPLWWTNKPLQSNTNGAWTNIKTGHEWNPNPEIVDMINLILNIHKTSVMATSNGNNRGISLNRFAYCLWIFPHFWRHRPILQEILINPRIPILRKKISY